MDGKYETHKIKILVVGPFRVLGENNEDLTPRGRKACGLLAVLALSHNNSRPRIALQDKLWSDRGREQGANSLRQVLSEIRRHLGPYRDCIQADNRDISFSPERVSIDLDNFLPSQNLDANDASFPVLLDGLDIRDPEFEHWLRDQRNAFEHSNASKFETALSQNYQAKTTVSKTPVSVVPKRAWVRIVPSTSVTSESGLFYSKVISETIARGIGELGSADISTSIRDTPGLDLQVDALVSEQHITVHVALNEAPTDVFLWSGTQQVPQENEFVCNVTTLQMLINQTIDIALFQLRRLTAAEHEAGAFSLGFDALQKMFKGEKNDLIVADSLLSSAFEQNANGVLLAWKAYLRTFLTGEHLVDRKAQAEEARMLVQQALQATPYNSHVLALASYVHSFVLGEYDVGHELAEGSLKLNPANPLGMASLGRAKSYLGQTDEGYRLAVQARAIAGPGPYRYTIDFLCGVAAAQSGFYDEAIRLHEVSRTLEPNYRAPLRYLMALYLKQGDRTKARFVFNELREVEPDFSMRMMRETTYPSAGLRAGGLLDVHDEEFE